MLRRVSGSRLESGVEGGQGRLWGAEAIGGLFTDANNRLAEAIGQDAPPSLVAAFAVRVLLRGLQLSDDQIRAWVRERLDRRPVRRQRTWRPRARRTGGYGTNGTDGTNGTGRKADAGLIR